MKTLFAITLSSLGLIVLSTPINKTNNAAAFISTHQSTPEVIVRSQPPVESEAYVANRYASQGWLSLDSEFSQNNAIID